MKEKFLLVIKNLRKEQIISFAFLLLAQFFVLANYTLVRSLTGTIFIQAIGAKERPLAWFFAIIALALIISVISFFQKKYTVQKIFSAFSLLTIAIMAGTYFSFDFFPKFYSYLLFIWKEVYIVVLVHLMIGYSNTYFSLDQKKVLYGPMGALGSIGGILGGVFVSQFKGHDLISYLSQKASLMHSLARYTPFEESSTSHFLFLICLILFFIPMFSFSMTQVNQNWGMEQKQKGKVSPLGAVKGIGFYVSLIVLLVALTQFLISFADQRFHLVLAASHSSQADTLTRVQGSLYSWINGVSFGIQILVLPWLLTRVSLRKIHLALPFLYALPLIGTWFLFSGIVGGAAIFIIYKGMDYSIFAVAKELLYDPLNQMQSYGAKYLVDMLGYRSAKAFTSLFLYKIQNLGLGVLNSIMLGFIFIWGCVIIAILKKQKQFQESRNEPIKQY